MNNAKKELVDWINFLYQDLLEHRVLIGGYYFTFDQLDEFLKKKSLMERRITHINNKMNVLDTLIGKPTLKDRTTRLKLTKEQNKKELDFITDKITAINKHSEEIKLPVTYEEFIYVLDNLTYMKDEVECFKTFLLDEVNHLKDGDEPVFYTFINDFLDDVKKQLSGEIIVQKVAIKMNIPKIKV